jgi:hypothetical protein
MSGQGYHFAMDKEQADDLVACPDQLAMLDFTDRLVDGFLDGGEGCGGDKGWIVLHRCLSNGPREPRGGIPTAGRVLLGGHLLVTEGAIVNLLLPEEVCATAAALDAFDGTWFRGRFVDLFEAEYGGTVPEEDVERFLGLFEELKVFYRRAACAGKAVVFVTDDSLDDFADLA